jgi:hypothetical protein
LNVIQFNKFAKFHNGKNIVFCKTDYLPRLFSTIQNRVEPLILISGNSDFPITDAILPSVPKCIKKWFAQCVNTDSHLLTAIPYGIENTEDCILDGHGAGHGRTFKVLICENPPETEYTKEVYANFSLNTNPIRTKVNDICQSLPYVTCDSAISHENTNNRPYDDFVNHILDHKMVVCPRGNAPAETHRFWEVLYMNRVPIIKRNKGNSYFTDLPVVVLDDWEQLKDKAFIDLEWAIVKDNSKEMLDMIYWEKLIQNEYEQ